MGSLVVILTCVSIRQAVPTKGTDPMEPLTNQGRLVGFPPRPEFTEPLSDSALIARIRDGQPWAWTAFVDRYQRLVYSVALRNGLPPEDAVDVAQNTFLVLLESLSSLRSEESVASWLMTVARRQSWRVRQRKRREIPVEGICTTSEEADLDWDQLASIHSAVARLGNPCRDLIIALYFDPTEPTYSAIARRLGRSIGSIGPLRGRCLKRLQGHLQDIGWT